MRSRITRMMRRSYRRAVFALVSAACFTVFPKQSGGGEPLLRVQKDEATLSIFEGSRPILKYRYVESPQKPYAEALYSPTGVQILRDSPADHKHHHALMFALAVDATNFWEETAGSGRQKNRSVQIIRSEQGTVPPWAGFAQQLEWADASATTVLLKEYRTLQVYSAHGLPAALLTWRSRLETPPGKESSRLSGSHYFGLGMRFAESMDKGGQFVNAEAKEGELVRGSERLTAVKWCAYLASADGHPVTVAMFDHPANPRHPARMFTMTTPFAYLAATLNLWKEPLTLQGGQRLELIFGIALWDGSVGPQQIESAYRRWLEYVSAR